MTEHSVQRRAVLPAKRQLERAHSRALSLPGWLWRDPAQVFGAHAAREGLFRPNAPAVKSGEIGPSVARWYPSFVTTP
jgi:hypothetical protein